MYAYNLYVSDPNALPLGSAHIIPFITTVEEYPNGQYWPMPQTPIIDAEQNPINSSSAYIGKKSFSEITESKILIPEQQTLYLGYFINPQSQEKIYLYGIEDKELEEEDTDPGIIIGEKEEEDK